MLSNPRFLTPLLSLGLTALLSGQEAPLDSTALYGEKFPTLDNLATGTWWERGVAAPAKPGKNAKKPRKRLISMDVPRDEVVAFALYTHDHGILKITAQLFPLKPEEAQTVRLELQRGDEWVEVASSEVFYPGWTAHFRIQDWDNTEEVPYRVLHGEEASFEGLIRKDPIDKDEIVVANLGCNSSGTPGPRPEILKNLIDADPDLAYFSGDQTYQHTQLTAGWLAFGMQFREIMRDRPTVTILDDHDIGQGNLWGEGGIVATSSAGHSGGYYYPANYINMVQRQMASHLPDPADPTPIEQGITVYYTNLVVGGIDFAILEDRKFKSGPQGKIPKMGPRPDHINDPNYDRAAVDLDGLVLLGDRQIDFLEEWGQDYTGAEMKCVLSQTAFCGAVHKHGSENKRLLADLDSNAWPQKGRNRALRVIRQAWAPHLSGDQHLAVSVKHGIDAHGDGPYAFTAPALVNTVYGRWWEPLEEELANSPIEGNPLPWTGDFLDGLGNRITMLAYANPVDRSEERDRADGYGIVRFKKSTREVTFECYERFSDLADNAPESFPGWPITFTTDENDGREVKGHLPKLQFSGTTNPVVQVVEESTGEILYTTRILGDSFQPRVYSEGKFTVKVGADLPDGKIIEGLEAGEVDAAEVLEISL